MTAEEDFEKKYKADLKSNFVFFRMLLSDQVDAILNHFINGGNITANDLNKVYDGLYEAYLSLLEKYPDKVAKSIDDALKLSKTKYDDPCTLFNHHVVFRISQVLICLLTDTSNLIASKNEP